MDHGVEAAGRERVGQNVALMEGSTAWDGLLWRPDVDAGDQMACLAQVADEVGADEAGQAGGLAGWLAAFIRLATTRADRRPMG
jgi:hypothetical protein